MGVSKKPCKYSKYPDSSDYECTPSLLSYIKFKSILNSIKI